MSRILEIWTGKNLRLSCKRVAGSACIVFSMMLSTCSYFMSDNGDVPLNVQLISLQFLATGAGLILAGNWEKTDVKE